MVEVRCHYYKKCFLDKETKMGHKGTYSELKKDIQRDILGYALDIGYLSLCPKMSLHMSFLSSPYLLIKLSVYPNCLLACLFGSLYVNPRVTLSVRGN